MTNISVGFGTDLNFKAIIKGIRIAIGMVDMKAAETVIIVQLKATQNRQRLNNQQLWLRRLKQNSPK
jgi:hypothetical protein